MAISKHTKPGISGNEWIKKRNKRKALIAEADKLEREYAIYKAKEEKKSELLKLNDSDNISKEKAQKSMDSLNSQTKPEKEGLISRIFSRKKV